MADPTDALLAFIAASPSPYHAVATAAARLEAAGFKPLDEAEAWDDVAGGRYVVRGGALVAWRMPTGTPPHTPFRIVGAHTDSPNLRLKPHPTPAAPAGASSPSRSTAARCSTRGSTATSACPGRVVAARRLGAPRRWSTGRWLGCRSSPSTSIAT